MYVPNDHTTAQCAARHGRLYGVLCVDPLRDVRQATELLRRPVLLRGRRSPRSVPRAPEAAELGALDRAVYGPDNNDKQKPGLGGVASNIFRGGGVPVLLSSRVG